MLLLTRTKQCFAYSYISTQNGIFKISRANLKVVCQKYMKTMKLLSHVMLVFYGIRSPPYIGPFVRYPDGEQDKHSFATDEGELQNASSDN